MKVFLLHRDRDFAVRLELQDVIFEAMLSGDLFAISRVRLNLERKKEAGPALAPAGSDAVLTQDLELATLWNAMADGDEFLFETAKRAVLSGLTDPEEIVYRQQVLRDCLEHPQIIRQMYDLAIQALDNERHAGGLWFRASPNSVLHRSVQVLKLHVGVLRQLRRIADEQAASFRSEGFTRLFAMLREELSDDYLQAVERHLRELEFKRGVLQSAALGKGLKGRRYVVRTPRDQRWTERLPFANHSDSYSFTIPPRDENGFRSLDDIRGQGINLVANAVAQSAEHVKSFFGMLRLELAFYLGCLNLHGRLAGKGEPVSFPEPLPADQLALTAHGLYDVCLTLHLGDRVVGNDVNADGKPLIMITGANQGGKSTLLRSLGLAHLMMQAGMFTGAGSFRAGVCHGLFTHYKREEDATMESGKLDEELSRMSQIASQITRNSILLCNESFASTNEREGAEIARQIVRAMLHRHIKVFFVTHMYDLAHGFHAQQQGNSLFLRAGRQARGGRTFKLAEGEPLPTSYGRDSYQRIFGTPEEPVPATAAGTGQ
ncbi:MAG: DNA mismatch repair protein MutS [Actinomycetota bacterium]|nr:DNA mismatch repair protein MutS [Actinomycetota bacterium]